MQLFLKLKLAYTTCCSCYNIELQEKWIKKSNVTLTIAVNDEKVAVNASLN